MRILFAAVILSITILQWINGLPTDVRDRSAGEFNAKSFDRFKRTMRQFKRSDVFKIIARDEAIGAAPVCCSRAPYLCDCCPALC